MSTPTGLEAGTAVGPYQVVAALAVGGMGAVYRARDPRLGRDVALKLFAVPEATPDWLARFEQEARATSALAHPNVVAVYDVGSHDGLPFVVTELLEGQTLRERLAAGPLPVAKAIDAAVQIAGGLAAAHDKGIVHRDLKPENVFLTRDGRVKLLDFGLAKMTGSEAGLTREERAQATTQPVYTEPGLVLGTVGYMSPEQVRGRYVDPRTDIFSLGAVLYEMVSGARAFRGESQIDVIDAIVRHEPADLSGSGRSVPRALQRLVARCLEKEPAQRFQSARDLAFNLEALAAGDAAMAPTVGLRSDAAPRWPWWAAAGALALAALGAWALARRAPPAVAPAVPAYVPLTFRRGTVTAARFAAGGSLVVYSAAWDGDASETFTALPGNPEARAILPDSRLAALSARGELAALVGPRPVGERFGHSGTLARLSIGGGAPRLLLEAVDWADWAPEGDELAVVRDAGGQSRLELPAGTVLHATGGWIGGPRFAPDGKRLAFIEHPVRGDDRGRIMVVERGGGAAARALTGEWASAQGLAWSPRGDEVWFTAADTGLLRALRAVDLAGRMRLLAGVPGTLTLHDVARDGRVLLARESMRMAVVVDGRDLSWFDWSFVTDLSDDGRTLVFTEAGGGLTPFRLYQRDAAGGPATRLGEGLGGLLSPDGRWVLAASGAERHVLVLVPVGAGEPRAVAAGGLERRGAHAWLRDGARALVAGGAPGEPTRVWLVSLDGGAAPRALTPAGVTIPAHPLSPDERSLIGSDMVVYPLDGGAAAPIPGARPDDRPVRWTADGRAVYVARLERARARVERVEAATGARRPWKEVAPVDPAGVESLGAILLSADGSSWATSHQRVLSELFLLENVR